jgi:hypothetical protein
MFAVLEKLEDAVDMRMVECKQRVKVVAEALKRPLPLLNHFDHSIFAVLFVFRRKNTAKPTVANGCACDLVYLAGRAAIETK